jgi:2-succinyl-5-enolpyruvyl-6-hydroxy-3-cyclohexene-1-carboxylate synthase
MSRFFDLVLIGGLHASWRDRVREFCLRLGVPVFAEALSGLREDVALRDLLILNEQSVKGFTSVLRIGNVPTLRYWRDLDEKYTDVEVTHVSDLAFTGLPRGELLHELPPDCERRLVSFDFAADRALYGHVQRVLDSEPQSEQAMFREISRTLPPHSRIYVGNSLPIREWDAFATRVNRGCEIGANRGANGIDGQLSTFFGWCKPGAHNVAIVGDLTAIYDLNAPWIVPQLDAKPRIIIINNRGGRIFERVASLRRLDKKMIFNEHAIRFGEWASMFGIEVDERAPDAAATRRVLEQC